MTRPRIGLLSLCAVVIGLMAVSACPAQASKWLVLSASKVVKTGTQLPALLNSELDLPGVIRFLTFILGIPTTVRCTAINLTNAKLEGEGAITNGFKMKFTGCTVELNGELNNECEAHSNGSPVGTVETLELKGKFQLVGSEGKVAIEPKTGTTLVTIEMGFGCPIGNKVPVQGMLEIEDAEGLMATHQVKHLMTQSAPSKLKIFGNSATLDLRFWWYLGGEHSGLAWSGDKD